MTVFEIFIIILIQLFFLPVLLRRMAKKNISLFDLLFLLFLDAGLSLFMFRPDLFFILSDFFGIGRGVDVFVYFGLILLFYIAFRIYFKMEKLTHDISRINRQISILNAERKYFDNTLS